MTRAADILRERAARLPFVETAEAAAMPAMFRAVADLMVVLAAQDKCPCCLRRYEQHEDWCALWAVQRAIEGEGARPAS